MSKNNSVLMRIMTDIVDFNENKPEGIYLHINKKDIMTLYALIIGPSETPYFGGFFFFEIKFPDNYPFSPPNVKFLTIDKKERFNPNLYEEVKVCLSILGTRNGPSWSPVMNLRLVLDSIRSLLGHYPIQNEPGFENTKPDDISSIEYNQYLIYHTYRLAIINVIIGDFIYSDYFKKEITQEMEKNKKKLLDDLLSYESIYGNTEIENRIYFVKKQKLNFSDLISKFKDIL
jgi:ubiquitin-protein ligase